jgi:hypothetical protein
VLEELAKGFFPDLDSALADLVDHVLGEKR